jgi:hypothetical protein
VRPADTEKRAAYNYIVEYPASIDSPPCVCYATPPWALEVWRWLCGVSACVVAADVHRFVSCFKTIPWSSAFVTFFSSASTLPRNVTGYEMSIVIGPPVSVQMGCLRRVRDQTAGRLGPECGHQVAVRKWGISRPCWRNHLPKHPVYLPPYWHQLVLGAVPVGGNDPSGLLECYFEIILN